MQYLILSLLTLSSVGFASSPGLASEGLSDIKPALRSKNEIKAARLGNASFTGFESSSGLDLFPRQYTCGAGRHECADGGCCKTYQNCVSSGCCDKPDIACGADSCYNPDVETCCEARGTRCDLGYECVPEGGCCKKGMKSCGSDSCYDPDEDECCGDGKTCSLGDTCVDGGCCDGYKRQCGDHKCYDPIMSVCCTDGDSAWSCSKGQSCCRSSRSCYTPSREKCCSSGPCRKGQTCCEHGCCDSNERCGANGYCTVASTSTTTSLLHTTATTTFPTTAADDSASDDADGGGVAGSDGISGGNGQGEPSGASRINPDCFLKLVVVGLSVLPFLSFAA